MFKAKIADMLVLPCSHPGNEHMQDKDITGLLNLNARNEALIDKVSRGKKIKIRNTFSFQTVQF